MIEAKCLKGNEDMYRYEDKQTKLRNNLEQVGNRTVKISKIKDSGKLSLHTILSIER